MVVVANLHVDPQQKTLWGGLQPLSQCNAYCHTSHPWLRDRWRSSSWQRGDRRRQSQTCAESSGTMRWAEKHQIGVRRRHNVWQPGGWRLGRDNWYLNILCCFPSNTSTVEVSQWPGIVDFRHVHTWCGQESSVSNHQLRDQWSHYQGVTGSQAAPGGQVLVWLQSGESGPGVSALVTSDNAETRGDWGVVTQETGNIGQSLLVSAEGPQLYLTGSDDH